MNPLAQFWAEWRKTLPAQFAAESKAWTEMLARHGIVFDKKTEKDVDNAP
jgi:hypothetical protein